MTRDYKLIRKKCTSDPDAIVALIKENDEALANEKARNAILEDNAQEQAKRIAELEERNRELEAQRKKNSTNSSKPPSTDTFVPRKIDA